MLTRGYSFEDALTIPDFINEIASCMGDFSYEGPYTNKVNDLEFP
jgi:hypothetical protein